MEILFLILYFYGSEMSYQLANDQSSGISIYPFGTSIFTQIFYLIIFITSIWMFGWIIGIMFFLFSILSFAHATIGWIFSLPFIIRSLINNSNKRFHPDFRKVGLRIIVESSHKNRMAGLSLAVIFGIIFMITNFFVYDYRGFLNSDWFSSLALMYFILSTIVLFVFKMIILYFLEN